MPAAPVPIEKSGSTVELRNFSLPAGHYILGYCHKYWLVLEQIFTITLPSSSCYLVKRHRRQCGSLGGKRCCSLITGWFVCRCFERTRPPSLSGADYETPRMRRQFSWFCWEGNISIDSAALRYFCSLQLNWFVLNLCLAASPRLCSFTLLQWRNLLPLRWLLPVVCWQPVVVVVAIVVSGVFCLFALPQAQLQLSPI